MTKDDLLAAAGPVAEAESGEKKPEAGEDSNGSTTASSIEEKRRFAQIRDNDFARKTWKVISWTPKRCRWDPESPPKFNMPLNLLFGFVSGAHFLV